MSTSHEPPPTFEALNRAGRRAQRKADLSIRFVMLALAGDAREAEQLARRLERGYGVQLGLEPGPLPAEQLQQLTRVLGSLVPTMVRRLGEDMHPADALVRPAK